MQLIPVTFLIGSIEYVLIGFVLKNNSGSDPVKDLCDGKMIFADVNGKGITEI